MKLPDLIQRKAQHLCIFGDPKAGKTELVGRLAETFKFIFVSLDGGYEVLRKMPLSYQERIEVIALPDTKEYPIGIETCLKIMSGAAIKICEAHGKVNCLLCIKNKAAVIEICTNNFTPDIILVFDPISQLANSALAHITKNEDELFRPDWDTWMKQGVLLDKFLGNVQHSKANIVCITHTLECETEDGKTKLFPQCGTRNFSRNIGKYFDHIVYCDVKNRKHSFGSKTTYLPSVATGSRSDVSIEEGADKPGYVATLLPFFRDIEMKSEQEQVSEHMATIISPQSAKEGT